MSPTDRMVLLAALAIPVVVVLWLLVSIPAHVAIKRQHANTGAVRMVALVGVVGAIFGGLILTPLLVIGVLWFMALAWAMFGEADRTEACAGYFEVVGVDRDSGLDTRKVIGAASPANAKAKAELQGMVVTDVVAAS